MDILYEEKVVAFIDVLGFSNLVYNDKIEPISDYYKMILTDFKRATSKNELRFLLISDSIVIHAPLNKSDFLTVTKVISDLQHRLLLKGILIRGAISYGKLYVNEEENIIVGPGMINAYNLESLAIFPRIIIDRKFINLFWDNSTHLNKNSRRLIKLSSCSPYKQDYPFIDVGKSISFDFQPSKFEAIISVFKENYYDNNHIEKYEWLRCHVLEGVRDSLNYLTSKATKNKNEIKRIKLLTSFINELGKI